MNIIRRWPRTTEDRVAAVLEAHRAARKRRRQVIASRWAALLLAVLSGWGVIHGISMMFGGAA